MDSVADIDTFRAVDVSRWSLRGLGQALVRGLRIGELSDTRCSSLGARLQSLMTSFSSKLRHLWRAAGLQGCGRYRNH